MKLTDYIVDIAVDGNELMSIIQVLGSNDYIRLGSNSPFRRKSILRIHMSNNWPQYRLFCIIHCLPCSEQRSLCVGLDILFSLSILM